MEQKEAIGVLGAELEVERLDAGPRARSSDRGVLGQRRPRRRRRSRSGSRSGCTDRGCRAPAPRGARAARRRPPALVSIVGTMTIVRASSGTPSEKSSRGSRSGDDEADDRTLDAARSRGRSPANSTSSATTTWIAGDAPIVAAHRRAQRPATSAPVSDRDRRRGRGAVGWRRQQAPDPRPRVAGR